MSEEKLRLVTDFSELRAGLLVVIKACAECAADHRMVLLRSGESQEGDAFDISPQPSCRTWFDLMLGYKAVDKRNVYIVDTGNDDEAEQRQGQLDEAIRDTRRVRYEGVKR